MGSGYSPKRTGLEALVKQFRGFQTGLAAVNRRISAIGIQVDKANGKLIISSGRSLEVDGSATVGGSLTVTGNTLIEGSLSVPNGSITNAALNAPVYPVAVGSSATNFSVPAIALHTVCTINVPVPAGFSQALVHMNVDLGVWNSTASTTFFAHAACYPGAATAGLDNVVSVPPNTAGAVSDSAQALLTGLTSGGNVQLEGQAFTDSGTIPASTSTGMNVAAIVLFLR